MRNQRELTYLLNFNNLIKNFKKKLIQCLPFAIWLIILLLAMDELLRSITKKIFKVVNN